MLLKIQLFQKISKTSAKREIHLCKFVHFCARCLHFRLKRENKDFFCVFFPKNVNFKISAKRPKISLISTKNSGFYKNHVFLKNKRKPHENAVFLKNGQNRAKK